ncbi:cobyrinate a,c-diamide synthase [Effusibacillus lacus]|uniref:Cobyrinate a,c-diamide synthase n=1 Tax=Effusibacillus lacus TaxID=1348429 RepID=A0A292YE40_9BACL|nr:cobyrinate a,c-diamide synthase [Effusibacillus lacus]TCS75703.1 cobyrinic acid a,c-diamide synthase [Effusibacillus lacus]GAX91022.1 cobyrinic acid a,c-diamide synthase [Effusibacillus lacus]
MTQARKMPRFVVAGTGSGAGKTTVSVGLMAAFQQQGYKVQGYKVGPDYIDPSYHTAVTGRQSRNLDTWMLSQDVMRECFLRGADGADLAIIEGVMGLYDGKSPLSDQGSTAEIAKLLGAPVILVINAHSMARSAAAVVLGFQQLDPEVRIAGVIANKVGSKGHYEIVKAAIEQVCGIPCLGYLERDEKLTLPERHLGLIPAVERGELGDLFRLLADQVSVSVDLNRLWELAQSAARIECSATGVFPVEKQPKRVRIGVARDPAFNFYYPENLELLEACGGEPVYFSPLKDARLPDDIDGLYIGGGFPEEFASDLSANNGMMEDIRDAHASGMPIYAECGGLMYLCRSLTDRLGNEHPMVGVVPATVKMQNRLAALGYREAKAAADHLLLPAGQTVRGHEFHYSFLCPDVENYAWAWILSGRKGEMPEGYASGNLLASYAHLHFASNPDTVRSLLAKCEQYRDRRNGRGRQ